MKTEPPTNELSIDRIVRRLNIPKDQHLVNLLSSLSFNGQRLTFVIIPQVLGTVQTARVYVLCQRCSTKRLFLYGPQFQCRECLNLRVNRTRQRTGILNSRYLYPLQKLLQMENLLWSDSISYRKRISLEKKALAIRKVMPEWLKYYCDQEILKKIEGLKTSPMYPHRSSISSKNPDPAV